MIIFFKFRHFDLYSLYQINKNLKDIDFALLKLLNDLKEALLATWRNGYAEDCKSFYPSSIKAWPPKISCFLNLKKVWSFSFLGSSVGRAVDC